MADNRRMGDRRPSGTPQRNRYGKQSGSTSSRTFEDQTSRRPQQRNHFSPERGSHRDTDYRRETAERFAPERRAAPEEHRDYEDFEYHPVPKAPRRDSRPEHDLRDPECETLVLSGRNPIREALKSGRDLEKLLVQRGELSGSAREIVAIAKERKVLVQVVDKSRLDEVTPHHQGLVALASAYQYATVERMLELAMERGEPPFLVLLDGITDPHNLGAIIRTAECAGAHGVIVPQHRSVGLTPAAVKASAGAIEHLPVARVANLNRTIEELQELGIWVYALSMEGTDYRQADFTGGTALVIGAEGEGVHRLTLEKCDATLALPVRGQVDSLNASVAAGIMMYHVLSCRSKG